MALFLQRLLAFFVGALSLPTKSLYYLKCSPVRNALFLPFKHVKLILLFISQLVLSVAGFSGRLKVHDVGNLPESITREYLQENFANMTRESFVITEGQINKITSVVCSHLGDLTTVVQALWNIDGKISY